MNPKVSVVIDVPLALLTDEEQRAENYKAAADWTSEHPQREKVGDVLRLTYIPRDAGAALALLLRATNHFERLQTEGGSLAAYRILADFSGQVLT